MKKILNTIIIIAGFLLLVVLGLAAVNDVDALRFIDTTKYETFITFLRNYGALIIVGALVFVNLLAKSFIKIAFLILFLLAFALYIFATSFPEQFAHLFGA